MAYFKTIGSRKRLLSIVLPLVLVNAGIIGLLSHQILRANAENQQVLTDAVVAPQAVPVSETDPLLATDDRPIVSIYTVAPGDTLSQIAEKFDITTNTIRWANKLTSSSIIRVGDKLRILPVSGIEYTVVKGDTISQIAERFHSTQSAILDFNDIASIDKIKPGLELIIPDGVPVSAPAPVKQTKPVVQTTKQPPATQASVYSTPKSSETTTVPPVDSQTQAPVATTQVVQQETTTSRYGRYIVPLPGGVLSQGLHDGTAVDIAAPSGTSVVAAASGTVTSVRDTNTWNGGYGYYLIIDHGAGIQTLYSHLSRIDVEVGDSVAQGEHIALSGRTGRVTGPHLHFEVRGEPNPFIKDKRGTQY